MIRQGNQGLETGTAKQNIPVLRVTGLQEK